MQEADAPSSARPPIVSVHPTPSHDVAISRSATPSAQKDSLQETKNFYGLRPLSPLSASLRRPGSSASASRRSPTSASANRPTWPDVENGLTSPTSRSRSLVPLATPRGFLSPKKPSSALRLEEKQRSEQGARARSDGASLAEADGAEGDGGKGRKERASAENDVDGKTGNESWRRGAPRGTGAAEGIAEEDGDGEDAGLGLDDILATGPSEMEAPTPAWDRDIRHSVTDASSPTPQIHTELSSDDLMRSSTSTHTIQHKANGTAKPPARRSWGKHAEDPRIATNGAADGKPQSRRRRRYETFENPLTTWLCGGRAMTGGDSVVSVGLAAVILLGISGVWVGTTGVWLWESGGAYGLGSGGGIAVVIVFVYLFGLTSSSMLVSSLRDPGIIPRGLDPEPPTSQQASYYEPLDREFAVRKGRVVVRYCETCRSYRPPRCSHCRLCGNCVDGIDHHCSYLHTCVGKRNYLSFLVLLVSAAISTIYIVVFSSIHFSLLCHVDGVSFGRAIQQSPGAAVSFLLGVAVLPGVLFLLWYHLRLLVYNLTTIEQIRASASKSLFSARTRPDNPFAEDSIVANMLRASLGRPQFPSWVQASRWKEVDARAPNPALTDARWFEGRDVG